MFGNKIKFNASDGQKDVDRHLNLMAIVVSNATNLYDWSRICI